MWNRISHIYDLSSQSNGKKINYLEEFNFVCRAAADSIFLLLLIAFSSFVVHTFSPNGIKNVVADAVVVINVRFAFLILQKLEIKGDKYSSLMTKSPGRDIGQG